MVPYSCRREITPEEKVHTHLNKRVGVRDLVCSAVSLIRTFNDDLNSRPKKSYRLPEKDSKKSPKIREN